MITVHRSNKHFPIAIFVLIITTLFVCSVAGAQEREGGRRMLTFAEFLLFPRVWLSVLVGIGGGFLLKTCRIKSLTRMILLALVFVLFAVLPVFNEIVFFARLAPHPSPMCAFAKPIMFSLEMQQLVVPPVFAGVLAVIALLSIVGNKLFCGWVCPIGALQEIFYLLPNRLKKVRFPFYVVNSLRIGLLVLFIPLLIRFGVYVYGYFNPFEILHWPFDTDFWTLYAWAVTGIMIILSLFIYRPFCHIMCPIGALTWLLEHIAVVRIRLREDKCNHCGLCTKESPCFGMKSILERKRIRPDCYACGKCITVCPSRALEFSIK
jgi:polyferredoxin